MNKKLISYGLRHSGINVLDFLLSLNFKEYREEPNDSFEWKYSFVHDLNLKSAISPDIPCLIVCVRDPYDWLWKIMNFNTEFGYRLRLRDPIFQEDFQQGYNNIIDLYNQRLKNYKNLIEHNDGIYIHYEDIILRQDMVLKNIVNKFQLPYKPEELKTYYKKIGESEINPVKYTCYGDKFSRHDIKYIMHRLDPDLMEYFQYSS